MPNSVTPCDDPCADPVRPHGPTAGTAKVCPLRTTCAEPADAVPATVDGLAAAVRVPVSVVATTAIASTRRLRKPRMIAPLFGPAASVNRSGSRHHSSVGLQNHSMRWPTATVGDQSAGPATVRRYQRWPGRGEIVQYGQVGVDLVGRGVAQVGQGVADLVDVRAFQRRPTRVFEGDPAVGDDVHQAARTQQARQLPAEGAVDAAVPEQADEAGANLVAQML